MKIKTERLIIRDFVRDDWESVHRYASDEQVTEYMEWGPNRKKDTTQFIEQALLMQLQKKRKDYEFAVVLRDTSELIGGCGIHINQSNGEIGYCFNPEYTGKGYATEAAQAVLKFGFNEVGLHRIYAKCRPQNTRSANLMKRLGMQQEGYLREHLWYKGKFHDSLLFSILVEEMLQDDN